jgi:probable rRNA maturation factor
VPRKILIRATASERPQARWARRSLAHFLDALDLDGVELSVWLCRDAQIRRLNRIHLGKDQATDVLSFPAAAGPVRAFRTLGDLVVSLQTARRRAREDRRPLGAELDRYLAHGLLHLLGHDHQRAAEKRRMARAEQALLGGQGMVE